MSDATPIYVAIVDDDESLCRSLGRLLRADGIQSITYPSGEAFLADTRRPDFHCLVLDVQLGGMSGLELSRQRCGDGDPVPFIFLTAHDDPEIRAEAEAVGSSGYFLKTDPGAEILKAIRRLASI